MANYKSKAVVKIESFHFDAEFGNDGGHALVKRPDGIIGRYALDQDGKSADGRTMIQILADELSAAATVTQVKDRRDKPRKEKRG